MINNGTPDITPPTFGTGKILTPSVSLSSAMPVFAVRLAVADNLSGVTFANILINPPGSTFPAAGAYVDLLAPALKRTVIAAWQPDPAKTVIGTYTISSINVCDFAGNCVNDTFPADIKKTFGTTTFQITR